MSKNYANEMTSRFVGCRRIAMARDETKNRDVRLYALPESFDVVGVNDGIDCWIAPTSGDPFGAGVKQALEAIWAKGYGLTIHDYPIETERYIGKAPPGRAKPGEGSPSPQPGPRERRKAILAAPEPAPEPARRRRVATPS